ncbi:MAG: acyltransferase family protein [Lachnospiraceae bacterium]|nr:acyltransferase family protein [Lachnospiraceae bacterium]
MTSLTRIRQLPSGLLLRRAVCALLAALLLCAMSAAVDRGIRMVHILPLLFLVGCSLFLWLKEDAAGTPVKGSAPSGAISGSRPVPKRDLRLDYLRLLAVVGVITIHAIDALFPFLTTEVTGEFAVIRDAMNPSAMKADALIRTCCLGFNIVYIMLSGALLLPWKEERLRDFYLKRVSKVLLPLLIYFFFYQWQNGQLFPLSLQRVGDIFRMFFTADIDYCPFYWLIYIIISLYLIYPFMRYMIKDLPYGALTVLAAGIILFSGTVAYTSFVFAPVIGFWLGYAILGYWITRPESRRFDRFLLPMGILQAGVIARMIWTSERYEDYIGRIVQYTPIMVFLVLGYFSFVYLLPRKLLRDTSLLRFFGRYSFSVILIHWWALYFILGRYYPHLAPGNSAVSAPLRLFWNAFASGGIFNSLYLLIQSMLGTHAGLVYLILADVVLSLAAGALLEAYFLKAPLALWDRIVNCIVRKLPLRESRNNN